MNPLNILLLHRMGPEKRWFAGVADVELMFPRYDNDNNYLVHNCYLKIPDFVTGFQFDAIIMMSTFMDAVASGGLESRWIEQFKFIKDSSATKIVFPQDDYWFSEVRDKFYLDYGIDLVHPVCHESTWKELIPKYLEAGGKAKQGFTTYITPQILEKKKYQKIWEGRKNDVVYRAKKIPTAPNKYGYIKGVIGERFMAEDAACNLITDISTDPKKLISGDKWVDFIADSRAILGSNSGSSVRLRNRDVYNSLLEYQLNNPTASWYEVEENVFDEVDRGKSYTAISPRNVEAALVGTLQILTPGSYSGFMKPYEEFLPIEEDCSNVKYIVDFLKDEVSCKKMIEHCLKSLTNEPNLQVSALINKTINFIRKKSIRPLDKSANFDKIKIRYLRWLRYSSCFQMISLLLKAKLSLSMPNYIKNSIKKLKI